MRAAKAVKFKVLAHACLQWVWGLRLTVFGSREGKLTSGRLDDYETTHALALLRI